MLNLRVIARLAALLGLAACLGGCIPGDNPADEEKDPHFQRGRNLVNGQDYKGAEEEFEKALETNPRSGAAHFEMGWLFDTKLNDDAAAIYHYERYLALEKAANHEETDRDQRVRDRIQGCKQDLAKSEFPLPDTQNLQREVDKLTAENLALKQRLDVLQRQAAPDLNLARAQPEPARATPPASGTATPAIATQTPQQHARVHVVKERETMSSIAAHYGVRVAAILAANPRVDPRRLRVGQSLNLP